jgi:hypothetical protein
LRKQAEITRKTEGQQARVMHHCHVFLVFSFKVALMK